MIYDCHIHIFVKNTSNLIEKKLAESKIDGALLMTLAPPSFGDVFHTHESYKYRIDDLVKYTNALSNVSSFFWLDPCEDDAIEQIDYAFSNGIKGIKISCNHFYPSSEQCYNACKYISSKRRPILFHSGTLFDTKASTKYNHPYEFEALLSIPHIRMCLAHISWPWIDEAVALFGKFYNITYTNPHIMSELFFDVSPGCPKYYRHSMLDKILNVYKEMENTIMFGSDVGIDSYDQKYIQSIIDYDNEIYKKLNVSSETLNKIYCTNYLKFIQ